MSEYRRSAGGVHSLGLHVLWCPKYGKKVLGGAVAARLRELLVAKATERAWEMLAVEVMPDHVHVFVRVGPAASASYVANQFTGFTSRVLRSEFAPLRSRLPTRWSRSYLAATVGRVSEATIRRSIDEQTTKPLKGRR